MVTFEDLDREVDQVEALLLKHGIAIAPGSLLERSCLEVRADLERRRRAAANPHDVDLGLDFRGPGREVAGIAIFLDRLLSAEQRGGIPKAIIPHLRLLNSSMVSQAVSYSELKLDQSQKQATDKVFELVVALAAAQAGTDLEMDDPKSSSMGQNPDVLITIDGERWGFACKVPNPQQPDESRRMRTVMRNVQEGMAQIKRSSAVKGQVLVNLRNLFDHDAQSGQNEHRFRGKVNAGSG